MNPLCSSRLGWQLISIIGSLVQLASATTTRAETAAPPSRPQIEIGDFSVTIVGAPVGSTFYVAGFGRILEGPEIVRRYFVLRGLTDDDLDGRLTIELPDGVPDTSLWAATNRDAPGVFFSVPPRFPHAFPGFVSDEYLVEGPAGPLLLSGDQLVVNFRRGEGAWVWTGGAEAVPSGDPLVVDRFLLSPNDFEPLADSDPPLAEFLPGDTIFSIDQTNFTMRRLVLSGGDQ